MFNITESRFYKEEQVLEPANGFSINRKKSKGKKTKIDFVKMEKKNKSTNKLVVAIDIGTKFSGFAYSLKDDWKKVYHYNSWTDRIHITSKTPTCLLLKKDLSESFFGNEAEDKFTKMTPEDRHQNYFFYQHFGKILHEDFSEKQNIELYDSTGKSTEASLVLEHSIRCLKTYINLELEKWYFHIQNEDIDYVFTVPDTRGEKAKVLIREAAINVCYNTLA